MTDKNTVQTVGDKGTKDQQTENLNAEGTKIGNFIIGK